MTEIDPARKAELAILERQKPMNDVIDRGDSPVQQFYSGAAVFVTGGSGFLGKQLIEKLFRSCEIKTLYMLLRPKKGKTTQERLMSIFQDPLYDTLKKTKPNFADKIVPVEGDVAEIGFGLSDKDWTTITEEVDVIIHMAATVRFDEPLREAALINVRGTREMVKLAKGCSQLKLLNHISTAFAHATESRIKTDVKEEFYPCPIQPDVFLNMVESVNEDRLNAMTPALIKDWPNTYTFTKAIAEELIRSTAADLPVCVVKPPVVTSSYVEPSPGWIDRSVVSSPIGFLLGVGLGVMHVLLVNIETSVCYAPVDYVNNAIIAAGWDTVQNRKNGRTDIPIYTVGTSDTGIKWKHFGEILRKDEYRRLGTPKSLWYCYLLETSNKFIYWILTWLIHYLPAYLLDAVVTLLGVRPKGMPSLVKIYTKVYKLSMVYNYFMHNDWYFKNDNLMSMIKRLSPADRAIYNCDMTTLEYKELITALCIGLRRFILKDNLEGSVRAYRYQRWFKLGNILFMALYAYLIYRVVHLVYSTLAMMV